MWYTLKTASKILALRFYNFWIRPFLVYLGIVNCCEAPKIRERTCTAEYYSYECLNCGNIKSGGGFSSHL